MTIHNIRRTDMDIRTHSMNTGSRTNTGTRTNTDIRRTRCQ
jgi:hypothetical protein